MEKCTKPDPIRVIQKEPIRVIEKEIIIPDITKIKKSINLTSEQEAVYSEIIKKNNTCVIAKAGTGKTTMAIEIAKRLYEKNRSKTLMLTYNRSLLNDVRGKVKNLCYIKAHNYHTLCKEIFETKKCIEDADIKNVLNNPILSLKKYDLIVIDEMQDMNEIFYGLIMKFLQSYKQSPTLLIMGDPFQTLYIKNIEKIFKSYLVEPDINFKTVFVVKHLSISFRITHEIAHFINTNLNPNNMVKAYPDKFTPEEVKKISFLWGDGIRANPDRSISQNSVIVIEGEQKLYTLTTKLYEKYQPRDTMVLGWSIKETSTCLKLANAIGDKYGFRKVVSSETNRGDKFDPNMRSYSTVHQTKGLEFEGVIIPDMSNFICNRMHPIKAYNLHYTASTRAKNCLIVCKRFYLKNGDSPFCTFTDFNGLKSEQKFKESNTVTKLISYIPVLNEKFYNIVDETSHGISEYRSIETIAYGKIDNMSYSLELTPYIGKAIPYMYNIRNKIVTAQEIYKNTKELITDQKEGVFSMILDWIRRIEYSEENWANIIKLIIIEDIILNGKKYLWSQIEDTSIIDKSINKTLIENCLKNLTIFLEYKRQGKIHQEYCCNFQTKLQWYTNQYLPLIRGRCDYYIPGTKTLIELKISPTFRESDVEQVLVYTSILQLKGHDIQDILLYYANIGKCYKIKFEDGFNPKYYIYQILARKCNQPIDKDTWEKDKNCVIDLDN